MRCAGKMSIRQWTIGWRTRFILYCFLIYLCYILLAFSVFTKLFWGWFYAMFKVLILCSLIFLKFLKKVKKGWQKVTFAYVFRFFIKFCNCFGLMYKPRICSSASFRIVRLFMDLPARTKQIPTFILCFWKRFIYVAFQVKKFKLTKWHIFQFVDIEQVYA